MVRQLGENKNRLLARREWAFCCALAVLTAFAYARTFSNGFVHLDDPAQLTANPRVLGGITWGNFLWSFTGESVAQPLTWLAYAGLNRAFGLNPAIFHGVSLLLHVLNALLLFEFFRRSTGGFWPSAAVASLFALHPINVESVAWVAELNNVLSGTFFMLTLLAYLAYARRPTPVRYVMVMLIFGFGLLAKQVLMTLPFLLLLLDIWPLERVRVHKSEGRVSLEGEPLRRLVLEKVPFICMSLLTFVAAVSAWGTHSRIIGFEVVPLGLRVSNAVVSYLRYLEKIFVPSGLAPLYAYPSSMEPVKAILSFCMVAGVAMCGVLSAAKKPWLLVGWLWFVGVMAPFLGLIQAGQWPEMAERYAYLTAIGVFVVLSWGVLPLLERSKGLRLPALGLYVVVIAACTWLTYNQVGIWKDSLTLFSHASRAHPANPMIHRNLGTEYLQAGDTEKAIACFNRAIELDASFPVNYYSLGLALTMAGRVEDAIMAYRKGIALDEAGGLPADRGGLDYVQRNRVVFLAQAHNNLGYLLAATGHRDEAARHFERALAIDPGNKRAIENKKMLKQAQGVP